MSYCQFPRDYCIKTAYFKLCYYAELREYCAESCDAVQEGASFWPGAFLFCQLLGIVAQSHSKLGEFVVLGKSISDLLEG